MNSNLTNNLNRRGSIEVSGLRVHRSSQPITDVVAVSHLFFGQLFRIPFTSGVFQGFFFRGFSLFPGVFLQGFSGVITSGVYLQGTFQGCLGLSFGRLFPTFSLAFSWLFRVPFTSGIFQGFFFGGFSLGYFLGLFWIPFVWLSSFSGFFLHSFSGVLTSRVFPQGTFQGCFGYRLFGLLHFQGFSLGFSGVLTSRVIPQGNFQGCFGYRLFGLLHFQGFFFRFFQGFLLQGLFLRVLFTFSLAFFIFKGFLQGFSGVLNSRVFFRVLFRVVSDTVCLASFIFKGFLQGFSGVLNSRVFFRVLFRVFSDTVCLVFSIFRGSCFRGSYFKGFSLGYFLGLFLGFLPFLWPVVGLRACTSGCWRPAESRPPCTRWSPAGRPTAAARFRGSPPSTAALFQKQKQKTNDKPSMMRSGFALWVPRWSSTRRRTRFFIRFSWVLLDFLGFYQILLVFTEIDQVLLSFTRFF